MVAPLSRNTDRGGKVKYILTICTTGMLLLVMLLSVAHTEDYGCGMTFCGCSNPATLNFETTLVDGNNTPLKGIQIFCEKEQEPIATSGDTGKASFSIETSYSPGCHYARCTNLRLADPTQVFADVKTTVYSINGKVAVLQKVGENSNIHLAKVCSELGAELKRIRTCNVDSECGRVLKNTSCGCTRDMVARSDADLTKFNQLMKERSSIVSVSADEPKECYSPSFGSFCDCPQTDGFVCKSHICTWNYINTKL